MEIGLGVAIRRGAELEAIGVSGLPDCRRGERVRPLLDGVEQVELALLGVRDSAQQDQVMRPTPGVAAVSALMGHVQARPPRAPCAHVERPGRSGAGNHNHWCNRRVNELRRVGSCDPLIQLARTPSVLQAADARTAHAPDDRAALTLSAPQRTDPLALGRPAWSETGYTGLTAVRSALGPAPLPMAARDRSAARPGWGHRCSR